MFRHVDRAKCNALYNRYYGGRRFHDAIYRDQIRQHLRPGHLLLDAGCGRYLRFGAEFASIARVVGVDLDSSFETRNQAPPFAVRGDLESLPFPSGCFDLIICRSVVEHLADPPRVFAEFARVLRAGGAVIILTPNKLDCVSLIAALTPHWLHRRLVSRIFGIPEHDVFPTLYRANTRRALRRAMHSAGLSECALFPINHYPAYLMFSPILFRLGVAYERLTSLRPFSAFRSVLLGVFRKAHCAQPSDPPSTAVA
jgi:SAM-dependent methyltransferase